MAGRRLLAAVALALPGALVLPGADARAQAYPAKPVRLIYPTIPGSAFELYGRLIAQKMSETLGRPIVGENRAFARRKPRSQPGCAIFLVRTQWPDHGRAHALEPHGSHDATHGRVGVARFGIDRKSTRLNSSH